MSEPTYRIDVSHDVHNGFLPWDARIYLLHGPDEAEYLTMVSAVTADAAQDKAQEWIRDENAPRFEPRRVYVGDDGRPVEGHSVKA